MFNPNIPEFNQILAGLLTSFVPVFPSFESDCGRITKVELTAAGTVSDSHGIPFSLLFENIKKATPKFTGKCKLNELPFFFDD